MVVLVILILTIITLITFIIVYNSFQEYIIRLNEAEIVIDNILRKKYDLLNNSNDIFKKFIECSDSFDLVNEIKNKTLNNFELNSLIVNSMIEYKKYKNQNENLMNDDDFIKIDNALNESDAELIASRNYYNDISNKYNSLLTKFPYNLFAKGLNYKTKCIYK